MDANKKPELAGSGSRSNSTPSNFPTLASIRRRYGAGWPGYEAAKSAWFAANPGVDDSRQIESAMRRIARAVKV